MERLTKVWDVILKRSSEPHFSLNKMEAIPPYKGAKQLAHEMLNEIHHKRYFGMRRSWEILIEVLAHHLGIIQQPWLYSDPNRDMQRQIDRLSPLKHSAFYVKFPDHKLNMLRNLLGLPPKKISIQNPAKPHHTIYYAHRYKETARFYPHRKDKDVEFFLNYFEKKGLLEQYIENARAEADEGSEFGYNGVDHLGGIFAEMGLAGRKNRMGQMLTPINVVDFIIEMTFGDKPITDKPKTVFEPALGTGRFLIEASRLNRDRPLLLFGVELDMTLYRAALVNMAIYSQHPYSIICADTLALIPEDNPELWSVGNLWDPPNMQKFYVRGAKPFKFSLAWMVREKKIEGASWLKIKDL